MSDSEMLQLMGINADLWTKEFMRLHGDKFDDMYAPNELTDLLQGWFANAIAAGEMKGQNGYAIFMEIERLGKKSSGYDDQVIGAVAALKWVQDGCEGETPV